MTFIQSFVPTRSVWAPAFKTSTSRGADVITPREQPEAADASALQNKSGDGRQLLPSPLPSAFYGGDVSYCVSSFATSFAPKTLRRTSNIPRESTEIARLTDSS